MKEDVLIFFLIFCRHLYTNDFHGIVNMSNLTKLEEMYEKTQSDNKLSTNKRKKEDRKRTTIEKGKKKKKRKSKKKKKKGRKKRREKEISNSF